MSDISLEAPTVLEPVTPTSRRRARAKWVSRLVLIPLSLLYIFPLYWMIVTSLKSSEEMALVPPTLWPQEFVWQNYVDAVNFIPFWTFLRNTLIITFFTILASVIANPFVAYGFSRIDWPGRDKVFYIVLATVFIPFPVVLVGLFDIFASLGWVNTYLPLIVPFFFGQAFWIFLMRQFLLQIPMELSDAARVDGASEFAIFFKVVMPLALPAIGVIGIFSALHAWNDFLGPLIYLQVEERYTLAIGLNFFRSAHDIQYNLLLAASTLMVLPVIAIFFFFQRALVEGITLGSIK